ncbi:MAG: hypothetical protein J3K34DRAFT_456007 [Monoraphidium minutum]|nr:MAG: hypothetical protein J3K34DRAFT_456007 [Monoraphidium minutum]
MAGDATRVNSPKASSAAGSAWKRAGGKAVALNRMGVPLGDAGTRLLRSADAYAVEFKPGTFAGGLVTVLALTAAVVYTAFQIDAARNMPPGTEAVTEWADTQGPFPMLVRCTAPSGCWISNRHNDSWSSHGDKVQQRGCVQLSQGEELVFNITFTQNPLNGFAAAWDPRTHAPGQPPGSGFAISADTNCPPPACPGGVYPLSTPVLGGSYLANFVQTENLTSPVAPLRREWFATFVSGDDAINPAATACGGALTPGQLASYRQATVRIMSAWYRVRVSRDNVWLSVWGVCGGAMQLFLQIGACTLVALELARLLVPLYARRAAALLSGAGRGPSGPGRRGAAVAPEAGAPPPPAATATAAAKRKPAAGGGWQAPAVTKHMLDILVLTSLSGSGSPALSPAGRTPPGRSPRFAAEPPPARAAGAPPAQMPAQMPARATPWPSEAGGAAPELLSLSGGVAAALAGRLPRFAADPPPARAAGAPPVRMPAAATPWASEASGAHTPETLSLSGAGAGAGGSGDGGSGDGGSGDGGSGDGAAFLRALGAKVPTGGAPPDPASPRGAWAAPQPHN